MRYCPSCNIHVEGAHRQCPMCQNGLSGEAEVGVYPSRYEFRKKSLLYKIQLFVLIAIMLVSVVLDFVLDLRGSFNWSIIVVAWVIGGQIALAKLIHKHHNISWVTSHCGLWLTVLLLITFVPLGLVPYYIAWIVPCVAMVAEIMHFIFMMGDRAHNAMIYLLGSSVLDVVLAITYMSITKEKSILWICVLLVSVICLVGAVIFKERRVTSELHKRFHI